MLQGGGRKPDSFLPANGGSDNLQLLRAFGNPIFDAQFDLKVSIKYCTVSGGVFTEIAAAALNATLKTKLPVFMFGHTDQSSGFAKLQSVYPVNVWNYGNMFVYGYNLATTAFGDCDATANAFFTKGDVVLPFYATTAGPVTTVAFVILSSSNVAYATLLDALSSDMFAVNMVRYTIADALVAQYNNTIGVYDLTLFGKFKSDTVNPLAFKQPDQQQVGIVDITIEQPIDKNIAWALYVNYDAIAFTFQVFAKGVDKLRY
jgi:hypothetical protein